MTQPEGEPTTGPVPPLSLRGLSDNLDSLLESDRRAKLTNDAVECIIEVANGLLPDDLATRMPLLEQQWKDWSDRAIEPLREAGQLDLYMTFPTTFSGEDGEITKLIAELTLTAEDLEPLESPVSDLDDANRLLQQKSDDPDARVHYLRLHTRELATRLGYPVLLESMREIGSFRRKPDQYVVPRDLYKLAAQRRLEAINTLTFTEVRFTLTGRKLQDRSPTALYGQAFDPHSSAASSHDLSPFSLFSESAGKVAGASWTMANGLDTESLENIVRGVKSQSEVESLIREAAQPYEDYIDKRLHVASTVLELLVDSDSFKQRVGL